jgi:hypothetical protein
LFCPGLAALFRFQFSSEGELTLVPFLPSEYTTIATLVDKTLAPQLFAPASSPEELLQTERYEDAEGVFPSKFAVRIAPLAVRAWEVGGPPGMVKSAIT